MAVGTGNVTHSYENVKTLDQNFNRHSTILKKATSLETYERQNNMAFRNALSDRSDESRNLIIQRQLSRLAKALSARTERAKEKIKRPITPDSEPPESPTHGKMKNLFVDGDISTLSLGGENENRLDSPDFRSRDNSIFDKNVPFDLTSRMSTPFSLSGPIGEKIHKCSNWLRRPLNSQGWLFMSWQFIVLICFCYNSVGILLRIFFPYQTPSNLKYWLLADYTADAIYIADIFFKFRVKLIVKGLIVSDINEIPKYYVKTKLFAFDVISLTPLDLLYFYFGINPILRFPRILKVHVYWDFFDKCDRKAKNPYIVRIARIFSYMLYLNHIIACAYYSYSAHKGLGSNTWTYDGVGNAYIRCYLFGLKAATSIGKNPKPVDQDEYLFMTASWLAGVFIFAILIGQIKDILSLSGEVKLDYRQRIDRVHNYMHHMHIPLHLQERINSWFDYNWEENKGMDEELVLNQLPKKMKSDLALYIHFNTLKKVQLFRGLETELLKELVLKLKPVLFLPGDYICRKGDVGIEMYIVNSGRIQVLGGPNGDVVLATLGEGSVFGEVSLLALAGGNRRTADVRSEGYSDMFVLNKRCLQETVKEYPGAQEILQHKARKLLNVNRPNKPEKKKDNDGDDDDDSLKAVVIENPKKAPQLAQTVIQIISQSATSLPKNNIKADSQSNENLMMSPTKNSNDIEAYELVKENKNFEENIHIAFENINESNSSLNRNESKYFSHENIRDMIDSESCDSFSSSTLSLVSCSSDDEERKADEIEIAKHKNSRLIK